MSTSQAAHAARVCSKGEHGFSLIELLVVVAVLAAVSFIAAGAMTGVSEHADEQLVYAEMQEIAQAIRRFKQDTGYYPKEGVFGLFDAATNPAGTVSDGAIQGVGSYTGATAAERADWFNSPANFYQLLNGPLLTNPPAGLDVWNPETARGWRPGGYVQGIRDGYVDVSSNHDNVADGSYTGIADVVGVADPFEAKAISGGGSGVDGTILDWSRDNRDGDRVDVERWGRPYLYEIDTTISPVSVKLISYGPNGKKNDPSDPDSNDDIELTISE